MYAEKINTNLYSFSSVIQIHSSFNTVKNNVQIKLDFSETNFNFNLVRPDGKDIRFSEWADGDKALHHWIAWWSNSYKKATVWINVPEFYPGETKNILVFFGNPIDVGSSNELVLGFRFVYVFNATPLDVNMWEGAITNSYSASYGYSTFTTYTNSQYFTTKAPVLDNLIDFEVCAGFYYTGGIEMYMWDCLVSFIGGENQIDFGLYFKKITANIEYYDTTKNYTQVNQYMESNSYNEFSFDYRENEDLFSWAISKRNSKDDFYTSEERKVEGNTTAKFLGVRSGAVNNTLYIRWVVVKENTKYNITIDMSGLYKDDTTIIDFVLFNNTGFSQDLTNELCYHESNCGGDPTKLSDNLNNTFNECWYSNLDIVSGEIIIDFVRKGVNLVNRDYTHYDSGHTPFFNASKLSDSNLDRFDRTYWQGVFPSGWACIDFGNTYYKVSCLGLKALDTNLSGMVKSFIFQGGHINPLKSSSSWRDLYSDTAQKASGWQQFYFINDNSYRYYRLVVLSTYGEDICLEEWNMYVIDLNNVDGYVLNQLRLLPATFDSNENYFPKNISFYGSNNFLNWTLLLDNVTTYRPYHPSMLGFWQRYNITNLNQYRAYKLSMINNWGATISRFVIAEWEMVRSLQEDRTKRILDIKYLNIDNVWTANNSTFDNGWVYMATSDEVVKLYDYNVTTNVTVSGVINDLICIT